MQKLNLINASDVVPQSIEWLWQYWFAISKLHLLAGAPGTGKTNLALAIIAILSSGGFWPCGAQAKKTKVILWSGEDSPEDTLVPRLKAMNARMENIAFVGNVQNRSSNRTFDPATDMRLLSEAIQSFGDVGLLVLDPIVSCIDGDSHKNSEVRRALQPLVDLGIERRCAILGVTHLNKMMGRDPIDRVIGSVAFAALARVVLFATKSKEDPSKRILTRIKSNIGADSSGYFYELPKIILPEGIETTRVKWGDLYEGDIGYDIDGSNGSNNSDKSELDDACDFIREMLASGPVSAVEIQGQAKKAGFAMATLRRAKKALKVRSKRAEGFAGDGLWNWTLPEQ